MQSSVSSAHLEIFDEPRRIKSEALPVESGEVGASAKTRDRYSQQQHPAL